MVLYRSTRGEVRGLSFEEAVLTGLGADRGLLIPEQDQFPQLPADALDKWAKMSYQELAVNVMRLFIDPKEISTKELTELVAKSYNENTFRDSETSPVVKITNQLHILELFHGPTFAFKDIALQFLGNLFEFFLKRKNANKKCAEKTHRITVVGATSGDTGSSAIYGLRNKENVEVFILYPHGRVSKIQERQMISVLDENIHNVAIEGTFDDCQAIVKDLFADASFKARYSLAAVNSINWARILAQIVYYVYAYFRVKERDVENVSFSVPTGNFGDILAGYYAKKLGLPIDRLLVATNENDILHRFFSTGKYHRQAISHTNTPSMDICVSSNFERFLFDLSAQQPQLLNQWMQDFEQTAKLTITGKLLKKAQQEMLSYSVTQELVCATIKRYYEDHQYLLDPHSAVGVVAGERFVQEQLKNQPRSGVVVVGTAHYGKFLPVVSKAVGVPEQKITQHEGLKALEKLPTRSQRLNNSAAAVADLVKQTVDAKAKLSQGKCNPLDALVRLTGVDETVLKSSMMVAAATVAIIVLKRNFFAK